MTLSAKEQANKLWESHQFYWGAKDTELEAKQRLNIHINSYMSLFPMDENERDYWNEVKRHIYEI